jgi:hypothetical protein
MTGATDPIDGDDTETGGARQLPGMGPRPRQYTHDEIFRTLGPPVRKSLVRILAFPLAAGMLLAVHPWSYLPSNDDTESRKSGQGAPYESSAGVDDMGADGSGGYDTEEHGTDTSTEATAAESASPSADGASQAAEVDLILEESAGYRESVRAAVEDATACGAGIGLREDRASFQRAADARTALARQAEELSLDHVDRGPDLAALLQAALDQSAAVDTDFVSWTTELQNGTCSASSATRQEDYLTAMKDSEKVTTAKQTFLDVWNPIAGTYGLRSWRADQF